MSYDEVEVLDDEIMPLPRFTHVEGPGFSTEPSTAVVTYRPEIVLSPRDTVELVNTIKTMQRDVLVKDVDYGIIPGTPKPSLLKPGAERLMQVFGLGHQMERTETLLDNDGKPWGITYKCTVTKSLSDGRIIIVSTCEGHCSYDENKWNGRKGKAPWNTVMKMAQKRALVGAALTATGASGLFTQDVEDYTADRPERREYEPKETETDPNLPTDAQRRKAMALCKECGFADTDGRHALLLKLTGKESWNELTRVEGSKVIDTLMRVQEGKVTVAYQNGNELLLIDQNGEEA